MWSSRFPCPGGSYPSIVVSIGTKHRVQSPLERWLSMISMNRPKMGSRPHEFLLQSGPITSWQIDRERIETVTDFIFLGSKITVDRDCSHELKRCLLLRRKAMINLDLILKSWDINLPTKLRLVKAMFFTVDVRCKSWTIKKAECQRIDVFKLWCWRRLLRVLKGCCWMKKRRPGFLASGEEFNPGPETRLDCSELCVIKFY